MEIDCNSIASLCGSRCEDVAAKSATDMQSIQFSGSTVAALRRAMHCNRNRLW